MKLLSIVQKKFGLKKERDVKDVIEKKSALSNEEKERNTIAARLFTSDLDFRVIRRLFTINRFRWFSGSQLDAIRYDMSKHMRILSCAGSGKTRIVCSKVAYVVIREFASTNEVVVCTFTRKSANEMQSLIDKFVGKYINVKVNTIHSWFIAEEREIVSSKDSSYGMRGVVNQRVCMEILDGLIKKYKLEKFDSYGSKNISNRLSYWLNLNYSFSDIIDSIKKNFDDKCLCDGNLSESFSLLLKEYHGEKLKRNVKSYDDAMLSLKNVLVNNSDVLKEVQSKYKYIFIDDYQDITPLQQSIIELIVPVDGKTRLIVAGDDDQDISSYRGSSARFLIDFNKRYDVETFDFEYNFRSNSKVVCASSNLIKHNNHDRAMKNVLDSSLRNKGEMLVHSTANIDGENKWIVEKIKEVSKNTAKLFDGVEMLNYQDITVLYPNIKCVNSLFYEFDKAGIEYVFNPSKFQEQDIFNIPHFRWFYNKLVSAMRDKDTLNDLLSEYVSYFYIKKDALSNFFTKTNLCSNDIARFVITNNKYNRINEQDLTNDIQFLINICDNEQVNFSMLSSIFIRTPKIKKDLTTEEKLCIELELGRLENLNDLLYLGDYSSRLKAMKTKFKEYENGNVNAVYIASIHTCKYLVSNTVFIKCACTGVLPREDAVDSKDIIYDNHTNIGETLITTESQRRLLYVAMTRAVDNLYITYPINYYGRCVDASFFLQEFSSL